MLEPFYLEREFGLQHRSGIVPDFDGHPVSRSIVGPTGRVPRHVCQRTRGLFLHSLHGREFQTLIVGGQFVTVSQVEKVSLHNNVERQETKSVPS